MNTAKLKQERAALIARAESVLDVADAEGRSLTASEQQTYDEAVARVAEINDELQGASRPAFRSYQPSAELPDFGERADQPRIQLLHSGKLSAFANTARGREEAHIAGRFLAATFLRHESSMRWCEARGVRYDPMAALSGGVNTSGGALVPEEMSRTIIELVETYGAFRANADNLPMGSDTLNVPRRVGGLEAFYVGENTEGTESDASWDNVEFVAKKLMVLTRMSSEISEDSIINLGDKMAQEMSLAFATKEDSVGFNGTGSASDGGQVGVLVAAIDGTHALAKIAAASGHDTFAEIDADDLLNIMAAIPTFAKKNAKWYCSPTALSLVF
ncbi:MAG: phage major capsid protein, partial [Gallionella sp.]